MLAIESSGSNRISPLHASGANGGSAAPRSDGMIRWWCPALEGEDGEDEERLHAREELTDAIDDTLLN